MAATLNLKNFGAAKMPSPTLFLSQDRLSQIKTDALRVGHENGYSQARSELEALSVETNSRLSEALQTIAFTHLEARRAILTSLEPLIHNMVNSLLPDIACDALSDVVAAQILSVASLITDSPVRISCAPENVAALEIAIAQNTAISGPILVEGKSDLQPLEVKISTSESERHLNINRILDGIQAGVSEFYKMAMKEKYDG